MTKKLVAELLGTFSLALAVKISLAGSFPVPTAVIAAMTLGIFVYTVGSISGAHINPSITIGLLSIKKIAPIEALGYLAAQFFGGFLALTFGETFAHAKVLTVSGEPAILMAEAFGTFFLAFGVASVVFGKTPAPAAGLTIGTSLLIGISIAASISNGVLNPAVAVGIGSVNLMYLIGPVIGAIVAFQLYQYLQAE